MRSQPSRQTGAALIVSLIMLALITLLAITSFRLGKSNLQIVGNMQQRNQALVAAQAAIETVVSSLQFTQTPANAIPNPCNGVANTTCVDVNGDSVVDVNVTVTPACVSNYVVPNSTLNWNNSNDQACIASAQQQTGIAGSGGNNSLCADTVWDTQATATDVLTSAKYVIDEGTAVRVPASTTCP
jgi:Tfp pilus assembly protein PilX